MDLVLHVSSECQNGVNCRGLHVNRIYKNQIWAVCAVEVSTCCPAQEELALCVEQGQVLVSTMSNHELPWVTADLSYPLNLTST